MSRSGRPDLSFLTALPFAHRGLHGPGRIENSRAAFEAAIAEGFGIELDVQGSADGEAFVFHDFDLARLTDVRGAVASRGADALALVCLRGTEETLPRLSDVLALIGGRAPLLVEIKARRGYRPPLRAILSAIDGYDGPVALMSFDPLLVRRLPRSAVRGLVMTKDGRRGLHAAVSRELAVALCRPDFLAYDVRNLPSPFAARIRRRMPLLTWTVRDWGVHARRHADQIIFEGSVS